MSPLGSVVYATKNTAHRSSIADPHWFQCGSGSSIRSMLIRKGMKTSNYEKFRAGKNLIFCWSKFAIYWSLSIHKGFSFQKRTFSVSKFLHFFPFKLLSWIRIQPTESVRIRISNTAQKSIQYPLRLKSSMLKEFAAIWARERSPFLPRLLSLDEGAGKQLHKFHIWIKAHTEYQAKVGGPQKNPQKSFPQIANPQICRLFLITNISLKLK